MSSIARWSYNAKGKSSLLISTAILYSAANRQARFASMAPNNNSTARAILLSPFLALLLAYPSSTTWAAAAADNANALGAILEEAKSDEMQRWMVGIRRQLHKIPELMYDEHRTSQLVRETLQSLDIPFRFPVAETGVVATIGNTSTGRCIGLRADMDGLPIQEESGLAFSSEANGRMHACGHDGHMTMLLGAARLLKAREAELRGCVRLLFQPAEEGGGGAVRMLKEDALEGVSAIFGIHVWPTATSGVVLTRPGMIMAASTRFTARILGKGGHAAQPHLVRDPITAAAQAVVSLQQLVARELSPTDAGVVSISRFNTGDGAFNVIPDVVELKGTIRASSNEAFRHLIERTEELIMGIATAHRCTAALNWSAVPYDALVNDESMARLTLDTARDMLGSEAVVELDAPSMAAEDFGFLSGAVPGCFAFLGTGNSSLGTDVGLHRPTFKLDESQLPTGAALHAAVALEYLSRNENSASQLEGTGTCTTGAA